MTITVIPAQPGFVLLIGQQCFTADCTPQVDREPIIGWVVDAYETKDGGREAFVTPVTTFGTVDPADCLLCGVLKPDGNVSSTWWNDTDFSTDYRERFKKIKEAFKKDAA
jgi:hypothetical protein